MKKLGFGLMRLPQIDPDNHNEIDLPAFQKMADAFLKNGFTYFDTAYPYHGGHSEIAFREAVVKRYPRDAYTVTDKLPMFSIQKAEEMPRIFSEQLTRCGVEYFDYYWLHALGRSTFLLSEEIGAFDFILQLKKEGKVKHVGFSFHDKADVLDEILTKHPEMEYVQLQLNYLDWDDFEIQAQQCYEIATKHKKPIIVMEPVKGGSLANVPLEAQQLFTAYHKNMSASSWAIRFAASHENVMMVLSGMSNEEQLKDNMSYMKDFVPLNDEEKNIIQKVTNVIKSSISIPCTACRYCTDGCPKHIAIPDCFSIYNNLKRFGASQGNVATTYYANLIQKYGKASDCIECKQCEEHCPQHLPITNYLKKIAAVLE